MIISANKPTEPGYYWLNSGGGWLLVYVAADYQYMRKSIPLMVIGVSPTVHGWKQPLTDIPDTHHLWSDKLPEPPRTA